VCAFAVTAELRNSLPEMIVDILQAKLDQQQIADVSHLPAAGAQLGIGSTNDVSAGCNYDSVNSVRCEDSLNEFPKHWEPMVDSEVS